jgi:hypothetical protein
LPFPAPPNYTPAATGRMKSIEDSLAQAAFGQVGRGVSNSTRDLAQMLDELRDAAEAIRVLAEDLDRSPDMLVKGRSRQKER